MTYKMLVVDIDDTLVNSQNQVSQENRQAIQAMIKAGYHFVLASGRPLASVYQLAKDLMLDQDDNHIVAFNGGVIFNLKTKTILFDRALDLKDQKDLIDYLQGTDLSILTYIGDRIIVNRKNAYSHVEEELTGMPTEYNEEKIQTVDFALPKIIAVGEAEIVQEIISKFDGQFGHATRMTTSKPFYLEIVHKDVSKGSAIKHLADYLNLSMSQIIAMGDGMNDKEMIQMAGLGVVVDNGDEALKVMADEIAPRNDDHGVAHIIHKYFLKD